MPSIFQEGKGEVPIGLTIRKGTPQDIDALAELYDHVTAHLEETGNYPGWQRGIYPARPDAESAVAAGTLFLAELDGEIAGSFVLSSRQEDAFATVQWQAALADSEVLTIHTLAVSHLYPRRGIGRQMVAFAIQYAREQGIKAIRLDVTEKNVPAIRLYESCGFRYRGTVSLGLEDIGLDWFLVYEKLL